MWSASGTSLLGPFEVENAVPLADPTLYAAHLVGLGTDRPALLGFRNKTDGVFAGAICPPVPVRLAPDGTLAELRVDNELPTDEAAHRPS